MKNTKVKEPRVSFSLKKFMSLFLSLIMLMSVIAGVDFASHAELGGCRSGDFGYGVCNDGDYKGTAWLTEYTGSATNLKIPEKIDGYTVTGIYDFFAHSSVKSVRKIKSIVIPDSIKCIGYCGLCSSCFENLTDIYYTGSKTAWKKIGIDSGTGNSSTFEKVKIHYNFAPVKSVSLSNNSYTYNGKVRKPTVTVKDTKGKKIASSNYTVTYSSGRKNVGKYTVTVKLKNPYSSTVKKTFTIKPKATTISKVTAGKKAFTVKWKKQATQTTGYQIQYSTSSKFKSAKTVTVSKNKTTSKKISKLKAKKKYYVRVRTYKTVKVNGKSTKIYSSWSKAKAVTTKK